jgi:Leucine-rich repeat (LRR) protein
MYGRCSLLMNERGQNVRRRGLPSAFCFGVLALLLLNTMVPAGGPVQVQAGPAPSSARSLKISWETPKLIESVGSYPNLETLSISCLESLKVLPDSIVHLTNLQELVIDNGNGCSMNPVLPKDFGNLRSLKKLVLYGAQDPRMPDLQPAVRHKFPQSMSQLKNLTYLDLGRNGLNKIPAFVGDLPKLRELGLEWNELKELPPFISNLRKLEILRLNSNDLNDLPDFLNDLPKLTVITLGYNCRITQDTTKMKNLKERFPRVKFDFMDEYDCPQK